MHKIPPFRLIKVGTNLELLGYNSVDIPDKYIINDYFSSLYTQKKELNLQICTPKDVVGKVGINSPIFTNAAGQEAPTS